MALTVSAVQGGSLSIGIALAVRVLTGQAAAQPGATPSNPQVTPNLAITPVQTGSLVYGSMLGISGAYTVLAGTTNLQDGHNIGGLEMGSFVSTNPSVSGIAETLGYTSAASCISICLAEILQAGALGENGSTPAPVINAAGTAISSPAFNPPPGSILVALVQSNGGSGVTTMALSDTSGLTWNQLVKQNPAGDGYSGIWAAQIPAPAAVQHTAPVSDYDGKSWWKKRWLLRL